MPDPVLEDLLNMPMPGFREIAQTLTRDQPPQVTTKVPHELMSPGLLVGPAMAMLTSMRISQDEVTGITYVDMMMTSMGMITLEASHLMVDPQMHLLEDVTNVTTLGMVDDHPT